MKILAKVNTSVVTVPLINVISDAFTKRIIKVRPPRMKKAIVSTIAGDGTSGFLDGPAVTSKFKSPLDLAVLPDGTIYVADAFNSCLLYTSDAADERSSVDLGGRRIIKKK